jgi:hypothetical protein
MELLDKIVMYQKKSINGDEIFGKMDPRRGVPTLREVFQANVNPIPGSRKQRKYDYRGSSAIWNDDHEFATPMLAKQFNVPN